MNEQTIKLLEELSTKLGTTTEMLWGALIKQAPISSATSVLWVFLMFAVTLTIIVITWRLNKKYNNPNNDTKDDGEIGFLTGCCVVLTIVTLAVWGCEIPNMLSGFLNPEYWALQQLLQQL